jgi:hypothetical protein
VVDTKSRSVVPCDSVCVCVWQSKWEPSESGVIFAKSGNVSLVPRATNHPIKLSNLARHF